MREIKFRVWNKEREYFESSINNVLRVGIESIVTIPMDSNNFIIEQFTGLLDKNKKDIYEGDIVKFSYQSYENEKEDVIGEVFFDEGIFYFDRKLTFATNDSNFIKESIEIIGNIFETPELISKCNK